MKTRKKRKTPKKRTVTQLKKELWRYFSAYIRNRDGFRCFTCDRYATGSGMHAGHFITNSVGGLGLRYDPTNVHAQCLTDISNLKLADGSYKAISEIKAGDIISSFDENYFDQNVAQVLSVRSFIPEKLYEVEMENGSVFRATGDHMVVSNGMWVSVEEMLQNVSAHDILER